MTSSRRGGVVFRVDGALSFLPADVAIKVMPVPEMARIPGAPPELRGVALVEGDMIPVIAGGVHAQMMHDEGAAAMLVCVVLGERVGLVGIDVVATGHFVASAETTVECDAGVASLFDVNEIIATVREGRWAV